VNGNLTCTGTIAPSVRTNAGREVKLYGMASPENWFEDFGTGQLSGGSAQIALDSAFASTINTGEIYHVFLTPNGDSKGLYVASKTVAGFEVREQGRGSPTFRLTIASWPSAGAMRASAWKTSRTRRTKCGSVKRRCKRDARAAISRRLPRRRSPPELRPPRGTAGETGSCVDVEGVTRPAGVGRHLRDIPWSMPEPRCWGSWRAERTARR
jgi:hypothetical protein